VLRFVRRRRPMSSPSSAQESYTLPSPVQLQITLEINSSSIFRIMEFEYLKTEKGRRLLHSEGHIYWHYRGHGNASYWRCVYYKKGVDQLPNCGG